MKHPTAALTVAATGRGPKPGPLALSRPKPNYLIYHELVEAFSSHSAGPILVLFFIGKKWPTFQTQPAIANFSCNKKLAQLTRPESVSYYVKTMHWNRILSPSNFRSSAKSRFVEKEKEMNKEWTKNYEIKKLLDFNLCLQPPRSLSITNHFRIVTIYVALLAYQSY